MWVAYVQMTMAARTPRLGVAHPTAVPESLRGEGDGDEATAEESSDDGQRPDPTSE